MSSSSSIFSDFLYPGSYLYHVANARWDDGNSFGLTLGLVEEPQSFKVFFAKHNLSSFKFSTKVWERIMLVNTPILDGYWQVYLSQNKNYLSCKNWFSFNKPHILELYVYDLQQSHHPPASIIPYIYVSIRAKATLPLLNRHEQSSQQSQLPS